jgi:hypothetical protein
MFEIDHISIEDQISSVKFACDIPACKGACCTLEGGKGAPLLNEEIAKIEEAYNIVKHTLPAEHLDTIAKHGLYEGEPDHYTTMCYNNHACVFVTYEGDIARCSIERAFLGGKLGWRKPVSCHLFPIRVERGSIRRVRYERIAECDAALRRGESEGIMLYNFLKEPLIRAFGSSWYREFCSVCESESSECAKRCAGDCGS